MKKGNHHTQNEHTVESNELVDATVATPEQETGPQEEATEMPDFEAKLAEVNDKYIRLQAEFDNYRKRSLKERMELMKHAGEDILVGFLPVLDNIERAVKSMDNASDTEAIKEGIEIIFKEMSGFLKQKGVVEIPSMGASFNTDLHNAVTKFPVAEEAQKGKVIDVVRKGYTLHDKVIRFAEVVVGE